MDIKPLLARFRHADETLKEVTAERQKAHQLVLIGMQDQGITTITTEDGPDNITGTFVQANRIVIDEGRLAKELGAAKFNKLCSLTLDRKKLEEAIHVGTVDAVLVASCSTEQPSAPYVKLSVKKGVRKTVKVKKKTAAGKTVPKVRV